MTLTEYTFSFSNYPLNNFQPGASVTPKQRPVKL
jgi:hypothetical protein